MKVFVALSIVVACIATSSSSPAPKLVDWTAVAAKASEMEDIIWNAGKDIMSMACNENAMVCNAVQMKVQAAYMEVVMIDDRANMAIAAQTLTEVEAKAILGELRGVMGRLRGTIQRDIAMLTPVSAAQIRAVFDATFIAVGMKQEEIYALLRQEM